MEIEVPCEYHIMQLVKKQRVDFKWFIVKQCLQCGKSDNQQIKKTEVPEIMELKDFNHELESEYYETRRQLYIKQNENKRQNEKENWFKNHYEPYLRSNEWHQKRLKVFNRDKNLCQACLENRATQVHHLTYKHVFNEPLFELVSICKPCHDKITELDNENN